MKGEFGQPFPEDDPHAISVLMPEWQDVLDWSTRTQRAMTYMRNGYPRFFISLQVVKLMEALVQHVTQNKGEANERWPRLLDSPFDLTGILLPCYRYAKECEQFVLKTAKPGQGPVHIVSIDLTGYHDWGGSMDSEVQPWYNELHVVICHADSYPQLKRFWTQTGFGISSRHATYWMENSRLFNKEPAIQGSRPGRSLIDADGLASKETIRVRIADLASTSRVKVHSEDVFLYHSGMSSISNLTAVIRSVRDKSRQVPRIAVFGFLYIDTVKVLNSVYDFELSVYGHYSKADMEALESELASGLQVDALITELPGNPLLESPDLKRLHELSQQYNFILIVDDTVGTFANVSVLESCDAICTSLGKMFSGACNVMGGATTLNPSSPHHALLKQELSRQFVDTYLPDDAIVMEKNSRDFTARVVQASHNAEHIVSLLRLSPIVTKVFYPKGSATQHLYDAFKRPGGGYGFLLTLTFTHPAVAVAFYNALDIAKGPSFGTNFTLGCAYALLAHPGELEYVAQYGITEDQVRLSIGLESIGELKEKMERALEVASFVVVTAPMAAGVA